MPRSGCSYIGSESYIYIYNILGTLKSLKVVTYSKQQQLQQSIDIIHSKSHPSNPLFMNGMKNFLEDIGVRAK